MNRLMHGNISTISVQKIPKDESEILEIKERCYLEAYAQRKTFFRDGAAEYLNALASMFPKNAAIMSNSKGSSISEKLSHLNGLHATLHIIGLTQKMVVGSEKGQIQPDGFPVPINPHRPPYLENLRNFHSELSELAVIGDNFFLDIATVLLHGGYGVLLETEATQGYEVQYLKAHPRGHFARNYEHALAFIRHHQIK